MRPGAGPRAKGRREKQRERGGEGERGRLKAMAASHGRLPTAKRQMRPAETPTHTTTPPRSAQTALERFVDRHPMRQRRPEPADPHGAGIAECAGLAADDLPGLGVGQSVGLQFVARPAAVPIGAKRTGPPHVAPTARVKPLVKRRVVAQKQRVAAVGRRDNRPAELDLIANGPSAQHDQRARDKRWERMKTRKKSSGGC